MSYKRFKEELKQELIKKREDILRSIDSQAADLRDEEGHHLADMEDLASDTRDETTTFELLAMEQRELEQIERQLEKIEDGSFGKCEQCGEDINMERLKALPNATLCIECKREQERLGY